MQRKILSVILSICVVLSVVLATPIIASADIECAVEDGLYYSVYDGKATVTGYDWELNGDLIIPETLGGYPVTAIGDSAFSYCDGLTSVVIPDSVTSISNLAFVGCKKLTKIIVDDEDKVYSSIDGVLFNKDKTKLLYYPNGKGKSYVIPDGVTSIGELAFALCEGLTSVSIPDGVISIGHNAFDTCIALTSIEIPKSVTSIGDDAFFDCRELNSVTIPRGVTSIGERAFMLCNELKSISIPNSVTSIGEGAFEACFALTSIAIPNSVKSIGNGAFCFCERLTEIIVDVDNKNYSSIDGVLFNKDKTELLYYPCGKGESYVIPNGVISIGKYAFASQHPFGSIEIPNSVIRICDSAFDFHWGLETVYYDGTEEDKSKISIGKENYGLLDAEWIYAEEDIEEHTTHIYDDENDGVCNVCGEFRDFGSELLSIDVLVKPREIAYFVGKTFDPYGIMISAYFANGFYKIVQTDYTLSEIDTSTAGKKAVTVSWCGKTTEFYVDIIAPNAESLANLVGIILVQPKGHLSYDLNEDGVVDLIDLVQMKKMIAS